MKSTCTFSLVLLNLVFSDFYTIGLLLLSVPVVCDFIQVYEGGYHALHHDLPEVAESVLKEVTGWITERLGTTEPSQQQGS